MKKYIYAAIGVGIVLLGAWLGGYEFDQRGKWSMLVYAWAFGGALWGYIIGLYAD